MSKRQRQAALALILLRKQLFRFRSPKQSEWLEVILPALVTVSISHKLPKSGLPYLLSCLQFVSTPIPPWLFWYDVVKAIGRRSEVGKYLWRYRYGISPLYLALVSCMNLVSCLELIQSLILRLLYRLQLLSHDHSVSPHLLALLGGIYVWLSLAESDFD